MTTIPITIILVILTLCDANNQPRQVTFTIKEEQNSGLEVGDLSTVDIGATEEQKASMIYSFIGNQYKGMFNLHQDNGKLTTLVNIDRETECRYQSECVLEIEVAASSGSFLQEIFVKVVIEDLNDNHPEFPKEQIDLLISEGVSINSSYPIESAIDIDTGNNNGIQSYEINPPSDTFWLSAIKSENSDAFTLRLFVKKQLDREITDTYQITVLAKDGGNPIRTGTVTITIVVTDVNEFAPEFSKSLYNITIEEDTNADSVILKLNATDHDSGKNGLVSYRIYEHQANAAEIMEYFTVGQSTGEVKLKQQLVYQRGHFYQFIVEALDNAEQPLVTRADVHVHVKDAKNNAPIIGISFLSQANIGFANVSEHTGIGTGVAYVNVEDTDSGPNGNISCSISNGLFSIEERRPDNFIIKVNGILNREQKDLHNVTVHCQDKGTPPMSSAESFLVRVTDYNDNKPVFDSQNYVASIFENEQMVRTVLQVSATDLDDGKNKDFHYAIRNQGKIQVNPNNGEITVLPSFDRETTPYVVFEVLAIDQGDTPLTGTATITLTIKDRNDNKPKFNETEYKFEISENVNSGFRIGQLTGHDLDINENGNFIFSLDSDYVGSKIPFTVFSNGIIKSNRELDREVQSRYNFIVNVIDQGDPNLSSSAPVTVDVLDINDNAPNITFPGKLNKSVTILYPVSDSAQALPVTHIEAYDIDNGENKTLKYSFVSGNDLGIFSLNADTGEIFINDNKVEIENDIRVTLSIEVRDMGVESKASRDNLIIEMIYSNATYVEPSEGDNKYIVISAVVVVLTVLISAGIIFVIFLLRNLDRKRRQLEEQSHNDSDCGFDNKPSLFIVNTTTESTDSASSSTDNGKKRKGVSFSFDDQNSLSSFSPDLKVSTILEPTIKPPEKPPRAETADDTNELYDKATTRLESLRLQKYLLESKEKQQLQNQHLHPDDSRSESSGETISADSGRGSNEEDATNTSPSEVHKEFDFPTYSIPNKYSTSDNLTTIIPRGNNHSPAPPPIPCRTYKNHSLNNNSRHNPNYHQYYSEPSYSHNSSVLDVSSQSWQHQPHYQYPISSAQIDLFDIASLPSVFHGSQKSRDDDDCSTTTSGSYTIYSEDLL